MRGVPDQTVQLYQRKDGHVGNDQFFQNASSNLYQKRAPNISYQDEKRVLDMKPQAVKSHSLFPTKKTHWK